MAILRNPHTVGPFRGHINKTIVVKGWHDQIILTAYPDMSRVKPSEKQKKQRSLMAAAGKFAREIRNDEEKRKAYQQLVPTGKSLYHFLVSLYLKQHQDK